MILQLGLGKKNLKMLFSKLALVISLIWSITLFFVYSTAISPSRIFRHHTRLSREIRVGSTSNVVIVLLKWRKLSLVQPVNRGVPFPSRTASEVTACSQLSPWRLWLHNVSEWSIQCSMLNHHFHKELNGLFILAGRRHSVKHREETRVVKILLLLYAADPDRLC